MRNLDSRIVVGAFSVLLGCKDFTSSAPDTTVKTTCEQVHDAAAALYWAIPDEGEVYAKEQKDQCEALNPEQQKKLLGDQMKLLGIAGSRAISYP